MNSDRIRRHRRNAGSTLLTAAICLTGFSATGCSQGRDGLKRDGSYARPTYKCHYTENAPTIDGRMVAGEWKGAEVVELVLTHTEEVPRQGTTARALWTDEALYIAFVCEDDDIWADLTERDSSIYDSEVVEVFIDANRDEKTYVELEINPINTILDMYILNRGPGKRYDGMRDFTCLGLESTTHVEGTVAPGRGLGDADDTRWTVEIAMPFEGFPLAEHLPPRPGDIWHWNLYRIDRPADKKQDEYSAWSPTGAINYHRPDRFGRLLFMR